MQTFKSFASLTELFDRPARWREKPHPAMKVYKATIEGKELDVRIWDTGDDWQVMFKVDDQVDVTGTGDEFTIFATVFDILDDFINQESPKVIEFEALKSDQSRIKLYDRFVKRFASRRGYDSKRRDSGRDSKFILTRKD